MSWGSMSKALQKSILLDTFYSSTLIIGCDQHFGQEVNPFDNVRMTFQVMH